MIGLDSQQMNLPVLPWRHYQVTVADSATSLNVPAVALSTATADGNGSTTTLTLAALAAWVRPGMQVRIAGAAVGGVAVPQLNGVRTVLTVDMATGAITFASTYAPAAPETISAGTLSSTIFCQKVFIKVPTGGADTVFGPDTNASFDTIVGGTQYMMEAPHGAKFNLALWYAVVASGTQVIDILYV